MPALHARQRVRRDTREADILLMRPNGIHAADIRIFALVAAMVGAMASGARADAPWFVPPNGWASVHHPPSLLGAWVHPGDSGFHQNMVAGAERTSGTAMQWDEGAVRLLRAKLHDFVLGAESNATSCGKPAHYLSYSSVQEGYKIIYEHMTTVVNGVAFFVIYARASTEPSLPEARDALTTLCGANLARPNPPPKPPTQTQPPAQNAPAEQNSPPEPQTPAPAPTQGSY